MRLTIIILSYNTKDLLRQTLKSIPHHQDFKIVVVDNASTDGSTTMIKHEFPSVILIKNTTNEGFAKANNQVISDLNSEYVMLLNSDVELGNLAIEKMLDYLDNHSKVGAITPKVVLPNGELDWACHRGMPTPWNAFCYFAGFERLFPKRSLFAGYHQKYLDLNSTHQVEATSATAMIVRASAIEQVGLLDERFFFYAEDLDWCLRIRQKGFSIVYFPQAEVLHKKSQSGKLNQTNLELKRQSTLAFFTTMKQFYDKHYRNSYPKIVTLLVFRAIDVKIWWSLRKLKA
jgi:GT2 family glycosyltransferase